MNVDNIKKYNLYTPDAYSFDKEQENIDFGFKGDEIKKRDVLNILNKVGGLAEIFNERFDKSG